MSVFGHVVQALTSNKSACPLTQIVMQEEHRRFILVRANAALRPVRGSRPVLSCT